MNLNMKDIQFNYVCRFDKTLKFITKNGCDKKIETVKESDIMNGKCFKCPGPLDIENEEEKKIEINHDVVEKVSLPEVEIDKNYINQDENKKGCEKEMFEIPEVEKEEISTEKKEKKNNYKKKCKSENCTTMISSYGRKTGYCLPCYNNTKKLEAEKKKEAVKVMDEVLKDGEKVTGYNFDSETIDDEKVSIENDFETKIKFYVEKCEQYDKELKQKDYLIEQQKETISFLNNKNKEKKEFIEKELEVVKKSLHEKQVLLDFSDKSFDETFKFIKEAAEKDLRTVENQILHYLRDLNVFITEYSLEKTFSSLYISHLDKWELSREIIEEFKKEFNQKA